MESTEPFTEQPASVIRKPTEMLYDDTSQVSLIMIYGLITKGLVLKNVQEMVASSPLYSNREVLARILGRPLGRRSRSQGRNGRTHLTPQQGSIAYQFADTLETAIGIFGTQRLAEEWLSSPSRYLQGETPLEMLDNLIGFRIVKQYLEGIKYGIYQ